MIIGLDVGGTHTDVVLIGDQDIEKAVKVPTDSTNLFKTVLSGLEKIITNIDPDQINRVVLSTTLITNLIVQDTPFNVGMIISSGPGIDPKLFCTNGNYFTVSGSIDHRGRETQAVNEKEIQQIAAKLLSAGIRHVGVVSKFSTRNPAHELLINKILESSFEKVFLSHQISGSLNFPRRIATTYLNAAVYPIHKDFYVAVKKSLEKKGLAVPIRILKPDGGTMRFEASIDFPAQTILSGPAASVMGSFAFASDNETSLVLDIGGTTTDMSILLNGVPIIDPLGIDLGGYQTLIRALNTTSIGIGGDSVVRADNGKLSIGPERLGVALAYGGPVVTPTDALFVLGLEQDGNLQKARQGIAEIGEKLNISIEETALQIFDLACLTILDSAQKMTDRINSKPVYTVHELWEGSKIEPKTILILGGPAPLFAEKIKTLTNKKVKVIPNWKVANAIGAALARTTCEVTLLADTEQKIAVAPEEGFSRKINDKFSIHDAIDIALELLKVKALKRGANPDYLDTEIIEKMEFNMVRGFYTTGKNIRIKAQVKPGLIHTYKLKAENFLEQK